MKTQTIDKLFLKTLRDQINLALAPLASERGITLHAGNVSYTAGGTFTFKLDGAVAGAKSKEAQRYESNRDLLKLPPLGTQIKLSHGTYTTAGLNSTGTKVLATRSDNDGKTYLLTVELVRAKTGGDTEPNNAGAYKLIKYSRALQRAREMMAGNDLEPKSALKQAGSDFGIPYGDEMADFVAWAEAQLLEA